MIDITVEGNKPKKWIPAIVGGPSKVDPIVGDIMAESQRREAIVRDLWLKCPYKPGDTVMPSTEANCKKYGEKIIVLSIVDTYAKFGKDEVWPANDCPMLVTAKSHEKDSTFICTTDFLVKKPIGGTE